MKSVHYANAAAKLGRPAPPEAELDRSGGWTPEVWLGAPAAGGLALPAAHPTASWVYAPRGVHLGTYRGRDVLVVADTGNHRVLIWHDVPSAAHSPCDVVLGQPDPTSEGPAAGGRGPRNGMFLPTGVLLDQDRLVVADAWHHRVLVYDRLPDRGYVAPDLVLGQPDVDRVDPNAGGECGPATFYWPFGVGVVDGTFYVADTGNRRVLGWSDGVPTEPGTEPDLVLGQPDAFSRNENRGASAGADSFRWPHDICGDGRRLFVADAGNHRVLGWRPAPQKDGPADQVLGQADFVSSSEWPYAAQTAASLRFPYAADVNEGRLAVADTANNRVLLWDGVPEADGEGQSVGAAVVLGQSDFGSAGENRWSAVSPNTLCWPYGLSLKGDRLAVADSGNNRIMLWRRDPAVPRAAS